MLRKIILVFSILFPAILQYGCSTTDKHKYQTYQDMKDFVINEYNRNGQYLLFFETEIKNRIIYIRAIDLQYPLRRSQKFKGIDIESYFKDIMLGKTILSCGDIGECFDLSFKVITEYQKKGIEEILKVYAKYDDEDNSYMIYPTLGNDEKLSVAYYFYLNNIYTQIDDYSGIFYSLKDISPRKAEPIKIIEMEE
jgi:hypothetical protein